MARISNLKKDPRDWVTAGERATDAQKSYIKTMSDELNMKINVEKLTKGEAARKIEDLQKRTGRG